MNKLRRLVLLFTTLTFFIVTPLFPAVTHAQQGYFGYNCISGGIQFTYLTSPVLQATFSQLSSALSLALTLRQNQPVTSYGGVELWALQSNELQIHLSSNPDGTKVVFPTYICGTIPASSPTNYFGDSIAQAVAFAQAANGGQAFAFAGVNGMGQAFAYAVAVGGNAQAGAFAISGRVNNGSGTPNNGAGGTYIVQTGDNLFRIALRFGTTVEALALLNGITDPTRIYVGQLLYLP